MSAPDRRFTFPEREYYRRCAMCGFIADPGYPWEERLQLMSHCPRCGIPLERLACQACGAPVVVVRMMSMFGSESVDMFHCGYCGEPVTRREPRHRTKPPAPPVEDPRARGWRPSGKSVLAALFGSPLGALADYTITFDSGGSREAELRALTHAHLRREAARGCAYKKADPGCRCPSCKAIRRHVLRRPKRQLKKGESSR